MFKRFIFISGGNIVRQFATFASQLIVAQRLGADSFGELSYAFAICFVLAGVGDFGSRLYSWRKVASDDTGRKSAIAKYCLARRFVFSSIIALLVNIFIYIVADGHLAVLLHVYSLAIVFNQVAFDWWFLSLEKESRLFLFNTISGLILLIGTVIFVKQPADAYIAALLLPLSYVLPAVLFLQLPGIVTVTKAYFQSVGLRKFIFLPGDTKSYAVYDLLQRAYTSFILIIAWPFYNEALVGEFRVAHLIYSFCASIAVYLGATYFNAVLRDFKEKGESKRIASVVGMLTLIILPLSGLLQDLVPAGLKVVLTNKYTQVDSALVVLIAALVIPALTNFLREVVVSSGKPKISSFSYIATILSASLVIVLFHDKGLVVLAWALVMGEIIGGIVLVVAGRINILPKYSVFILAIAVSLFLLFSIAMENIATLFSVQTSLSGLISVSCIMGVVYALYLLIVYKKARLIN